MKSFTKFSLVGLYLLIIVQCQRFPFPSHPCKHCTYNHLEKMHFLDAKHIQYCILNLVCLPFITCELDIYYLCELAHFLKYRGYSSFPCSFVSSVYMNSRSPTYEPSNCKLSKMWMWVPSTSRCHHEWNCNLSSVFCYWRSFSSAISRPLSILQ